MNLKTIFLSSLLLAVFVVPSQVLGLSYNANRRVKAIRSSLKYLQRRFKAGRLREVRKRWNWSVEKQWTKFTEQYVEELDDPKVLRLKRDIFAFKQKIFGKGSGQGTPTPSRTRRNQPPQPRVGVRRAPSRKVPPALRWGRAKLTKLEGRVQYIKQMLSMGQFAGAARSLRTTESHLQMFLNRPMYRPYFSARHKRVVRLRRNLTMLRSYVRQKKKWAVDMSTCSRTVCVQLKTKHGMSCPGSLASTPSVRSVLERDNQRFMKKLNRMMQARKVLGRFFRKNPNCCSQRLRSEYQQCQRAQGFFQKRWQDYLTFIQKCRSRRACLAALKRNNHPMLGQDVRAIQQRLGRQNRYAAKRAKRHAARVARTFCPPQNPKYANARLRRAVRSAVVKSTLSFARSWYRKKVGKHTLISRVRTSYNRRRRIQYQSLGVRVCVKNINKRKGTTSCRAYKMTVRRARRVGGRWGRWRYFSAGSSYDINCNSYR
ncbi:MAG: hypothetical protein EP343_25130 [Deltaproteobacteria bacterium]|nr:MAG: hypothetical protein EP343_25130 [Deltaproteobacteria bacterium]